MRHRLFCRVHEAVAGRHYRTHDRDYITDDGGTLHRVRLHELQAPELMEKPVTLKGKDYPRVVDGRSSSSRNTWII